MNSALKNFDNVTTYYTIEQVSALVGVEQWRVRRAIKRGALRTQERRSRVVVPAFAVARLLGGDVR